MQKLTKTIESLKKTDGNMNRQVFWELKRMIDPKKSIEHGSSINNDEGEKEEDINRIKEVYRKWYIQLFENRNRQQRKK